jgi:subfamily B ATP-binding cassette protein MsbA
VIEARRSRGVTVISDKKKIPSDAFVYLRRVFADEGHKHLPYYIAAIVLGGIEAAMGGLSALMLAPIMKGLSDIGSMGHIFALAGEVVGIYVVKGLAGYAENTILARVGNRIIANIQQRLFDHTLVQGMPYFQANHSAALISINQFVGTSTQSAAAVIVGSITNVFAVIAYLMVMIYRDPFLATAALLGMPIAVFGIRYLTKRIGKVVNRQYASFALINAVLQETAQGIRVVKSFNMEETMRQRMVVAVGIAERMGNRMSELTNRSSPIMETLAGFAIALVLIYGGWRISIKALTLPDLVSFLTAFFMVYAPAKVLGKVNVQIAQALVGIKMYYSIMDQAPAEGPAELNKPALVNKGSNIVFDHVTFGYQPGEPVLRDLSLVAAGGKTTALVGQSGGGKSTIVNMILRFYDAHAGTISVDGQDVKSVSLPSLRGSMAYVGQDAFLFAGTIRENIASGREGATGEQIIAAAKAAHAHDFIMAFPQGYDTPVGERGTQLSGGQRARVTIARAILRDASIILLDEATAALDSESEKAVQNALDELCIGRTVVVIAHRLQTIQRADKICVVEGGRIVEEGTHEQLLARNGRYAFLHSVQFRESAELAAV